MIRTILGCRHPFVCLAALVALLVAASTALAQDPPASVPPVAPSADPFYTPPAGYAATAPGTVLRWRTVPVTSLSELATSGAAAAYQLLYRTTDVNGGPSVTATTLLLPAHPAAGPRRLVSHGVPEDSLTTMCAPSYTLRLLQGAYALGDTDFLSIVPGELARGWDVVIPDYEGPDSELLAGVVAGRATLDGIRAAINFAPAQLPGDATEVGLTGYSGGSVSSIWAGALAPSYAPELHLAGITAGGVIVDPAYILSRIDNTLLFGGELAGLVALDRAYPSLDAAGLLNAAGQAQAQLIARDAKGCAGGVTGYPFGHTSEYFNYPSAAALDAVPRVKAVLAKVDAATGPTPTAPVFLLNTTNDEIMFPAQVEELVHAYCSTGLPVDFDLTPGEHITGEELYAPAALAYLADRFGGDPPPSNCAADGGAATGSSPASAPAAARCSSSRTLRYRLPRGATLRSVTVNGRHLWIRPHRGVVIVSLAGQTGRVSVIVRGVTAAGRSFVHVSDRQLCAP